MYWVQPIVHHRMIWSNTEIVNRYWMVLGSSWNTSKTTSIIDSKLSAAKDLIHDDPLRRFNKVFGSMSVIFRGYDNDLKYSRHLKFTSIQWLTSLLYFKDFGQRVLGAKFSWVIPLSVAVSTFGAANGTVFAAGRYIWRFLHLLPPTLLHCLEILDFFDLH